MKVGYKAGEGIIVIFEEVEDEVEWGLEILEWLAEEADEAAQKSFYQQIELIKSLRGKTIH
ncbi:MAG: hypothetical protein AAB944_02395 [Patescibacteria group bacterium]